MESIPQSPRIPKDMVYRDTGFPEPFCGERNTTLAHPDAVTGPNACISADDVSVSKVLYRSRKSFLGSSRYKRTLHHGRITPAMEQMYSDTSDIFDSSYLLTPVMSASTTAADPAGWRHSKDGSLYEGRSSGSAHGGDGDEVDQARLKTAASAAPSSPTQSSTSSNGRRSVLQRLRWHK